LILVVDTSVVLKWFFYVAADEEHVDRALAILTAVDTQQVTMVQPPHFLAEVAAVGRSYGRFWREMTNDGIEQTCTPIPSHPG
jgi:predicted nucleic acid-binding protein